MKIKDLRPEEDFIIKVRVSKKGQVQEYWKDSLPSKRLTVTLEDRNGDKINATFFDYYDDFIREGVKIEKSEIADSSFGPLPPFYTSQKLNFLV